MWPADHPIWKLAQSMIALIGIIWMGYHGTHHDIDSVATGVGGIAIVSKLAYQHFS